nr:hypothetical protein [uncultured Alloprevotella sp.]
MPARIMPTIDGTRKRSSTIGASRMMLKTMKNIHVGSVIGKYWLTEMLIVRRFWC